MKRYICAVCGRVAYKPVISRKDGRAYCRKCLEKKLEKEEASKAAPPKNGPQKPWVKAFRSKYMFLALFCIAMLLSFLFRKKELLTLWAASTAIALAFLLVYMGCVLIEMRIDTPHG